MAWTAKATYDNFALIGEDVSPIVRNYSPFDTPLLDLLPEAPFAAMSTDHQWTEESLGPDTLVTSTAINSVNTATSGVTINGFGNQLQVGMLLEIQSNVAGVANEIVQIASIPGVNSLLLTRQFASSPMNSLVVGGELTVISTAELEGSTTTGDVNRPRTRRRNYLQIFKKPVTITGTDRAVMYSPDLGDEFDHQVVLRTRELMRDVEKAVFRGRLSGNSIGSATAYRTMDGLRGFITGINSAIVATSFAADPLLYTNNLLQSSWNVGQRGLDILVAGAQWKRELSAVASTSRVVSDSQNDSRIVQFKDYLQTDFGTVRLLMSPWLNNREMFGLSSKDIFVPPLRGRSFAKEDIAKTGDATVAHVIGEYTLEIHHPDMMFRAFA